MLELLLNKLRLNINEKYIYYIRITGTLVIISMCVALLLGAVNMITEDKIKANLISEFSEAVQIIFPGSDNITEIDITAEPPVDVVYEVNKGGEHIGYCIKTLPSGFKDEIKIIVGTDLSGSVIGIQIMANSETPGLGTRVFEEDYLSAFNGMNSQIEFGYAIDAVAGATVTSNAVLAGVNAALAVEGLFDDGGAEQ